MAIVSVVVPYWRGPQYLEDCIASIGKQNVSCEILLVCDRGHDEVPLSVRKTPGVRVLEAEEEAAGEGNTGARQPFGVAFCRNLALDRASSKYVYFIDSDDYLQAGSLCALVMLAEDKDALAVTGNQFYSWHSSFNLDAGGAEKETGIMQTGPLPAEMLCQRFPDRITVQHFLVRRSLIETNRLRFDPGQFRYSDMGFIIRLLQCVSENMWCVCDSVYISRRHNDRIHLPALSQTEDINCASEYLDAWQKAMSDIKNGSWHHELVNLLNHALVYFIQSHYPSHVSPSVLPRVTEFFAQMEGWKELVWDRSFWQRRMLSSIRAGHYKAARIFHKCHIVKKKKRGVFGSRIQWYRGLEKLVFQKMPLRKDWILLESFFGRSYSDSPKYLYEYLQKNYGSHYRYIWVLDGRSEELEKTGRHTVCRLESLRYVYYMARCGYRIFNVRQPSWNKKREGVVFLETWHGTPLKKLGFDMGDVFSSNPDFKAVFYNQAREWDYLVSANPFSTDVFERAFGYDRERILEYGYPRNDILYAEDRDRIALDVRRELGIPENKRVILYAPTWRDDQAVSVGKYRFDLALDLSRMQKELGHDSVILLRTHYYVAQQMDLTAYQGFVCDGSRYEDVSRLYLASDILVTDYSSVFFDYANLKRPILFFTYDYETYADEMRGLYIDMEEELPGPVLKTNEELLEALQHMERVTEEYQSRYEEFYGRFCSVDDGRAAERVIRRVFGEREGGIPDGKKVI